MWVLLAVYLKQNFGVAEATYSWIPTTNALMVVFLQVFITQITKRYRDTQVMPIGALFYAAAMMIVGLSSKFWGFWFGNGCDDAWRTDHRTDRNNFRSKPGSPGSTRAIPGDIWAYLAYCCGDRSFRCGNPHRRFWHPLALVR